MNINLAKSLIIQAIVENWTCSYEMQVDTKAGLTRMITSVKANLQSNDAGHSIIRHAIEQNREHEEYLHYWAPIDDILAFEGSILEVIKMTLREFRIKEVSDYTILFNQAAMEATIRCKGVYRHQIELITSALGISSAFLSLEMIA